MSSNSHHFATEREGSPFASVIIATYNRERLLCQTIDGLLDQSYPHYELIVVDQSQTHRPQTIEYLQNRVARGEIDLYQLYRANLPAARNFGIRRARGDIVLFVDDDVLPDEGLIEAHVDAYESPDIGGVAGRRRLSSGQEQPEESSPVGMFARDLEHVTNFSSSHRVDSVEWASGCNMSFRKELCQDLGYFEPRFIGAASYEESDFCARLTQAGYRIVFEPKADLLHVRGETGGCSNRQQGPRYYYSYFHNSVLFALRNGSLSDFMYVLWRRALQAAWLTKTRRTPVFIPILIWAGAIGLLSHIGIGISTRWSAAFRRFAGRNRRASINTAATGAGS